MFFFVLFLKCVLFGLFFGRVHSSALRDQLNIDFTVEWKITGTPPTPYQVCLFSVVPSFSQLPYLFVFFLLTMNVFKLIYVFLFFVAFLETYAH